MDASTCRTAGLVLTLVFALAAAAGLAQDLRISDIRIDQPSTDADEYFELVGPPGTPLDGLIFVDGFESGDVNAWSGSVP